MIRKYKNTLILTSLVILLPIPVQLLLGKTGTWYFPLLMLAAQWFCVYWTAKDPRQEKQGKKPTLLILWLMPLLSNVMAGINIALLSGWEFSISAVFCLLFGLMFMVIGNYLPKVRQNSTLGLKLVWTYSSEENWNASHRFGGRVWFIGGLVIALAAPLPEIWAMWVLFGGILVMVLLPMVYSWRYYRMQKARGDVLTPVIPAFSGKTGKLSLVFVIALAVFVGTLMFTGDLEYRFEEDYFLIEASHHDDLILYYDVIESIEYREENVEGLRTWGFASARLLMGTFQNEEFGNFTRYTYTDPGSAVVLTTMKQTYVLSGRDPGATREIYEILLEKIG